jgi:hypothetical protein
MLKSGFRIKEQFRNLRNSETPVIEKTGYEIKPSTIGLIVVVIIILVIMFKSK